MNTIEHYRVYLSGEPYVTSEFETLDDLLNIEFVKDFIQRPNFKTLCMSKGTLFAVYNNYAQTIGYLDADLDLPSLLDCWDSVAFSVA